MDIKDFATMISGRQIGEELTKDEVKLAKELGYVVVFGVSDDGVDFSGAIDDEVGCQNDSIIYLDENGVFEKCKCECKYSKAAKEKCSKIQVKWCDGPYDWSYSTEIPHETFEIMEDDDKYCEGIVFHKSSLKK